MSTMDISIPEEILIEILSRLPVKPLLRFKCISTYCQELIASPYFVKSHLHWASTNTPGIIFSVLSDGDTSSFRSLESNYEVSFASNQVKMVGSCKGLICLSDYKSSVILCNPATRESKVVPFDLVEETAGMNRSVDLGFGYDRLTDAYKVVRVDIYLSTGDTAHEEHFRAFVYTLGRNGWREIQIPYRLADNEYCITYVNGAIHWFRLADKSRWNDLRQIVNQTCFISFNVGSEEFHELHREGGFIGGRLGMGVLQECLCICHYHDNNCLTDIWLMKDYGVKESWSKLYSFGLPVELYFEPDEPLVVWRSNKILLRGKNSKSGCLYVYDLTNKSVVEFLHGISNWTDVIPYTETLVSLASFSHGGTYGEDNSSADVMKE